MNVNLLKDSGVGKTVKKAIKKPMGLDAELKSDLNDILSSWMEMAETNGVVVNAKESSGKLPAAKQDDSTMEDLQVAETCQTWRQLFAALQHRNEELRTTQGKRMREIRKNVSATHTSRASVGCMPLITYSLGLMFGIPFTARTDSSETGQGSTIIRQTATGTG